MFCSRSLLECKALESERKLFSGENSAELEFFDLKYLPRKWSVVEDKSSGTVF